MPPDYSGQNLRGRSFKGQDLTGANFSQSEIQQLLQILNQSYPPDIPTDTQAEIEVAVKGINKNPQLKERVIGALKAGGIEAIKELADNIYVNVLIAAYDGWKNPQS